MNIPAELLLHLLHRNAIGTLATHSRAPEGFPYPTAVPFAVDARHRPVVLVSALAEHTRNLAADPRAGFLVVDEPCGVASDKSGALGVLGAPGVLGASGTPGMSGTSGGVLDTERVTLLGRFERVEADADFARRYVRYHPDGARYLSLGDFSFWVLTAERLRYIGGFGRMGWLEAGELDPLPPLGGDEERALWEVYDRGPQRRDGLDLLGVDRYGADWCRAGARLRTPFGTPQPDADKLAATLRAAAATLFA